MKRIQYIFILLAAIAISGCTGTTAGTPAKTSDLAGSLPSWVYSPPDVPGYVYGVGAAEIYATPAEALVRAKENARLELVKQLRVKVSGETEASIKREINEGQSKITRKIMNYARSSVQEAELPGIKIVKTAVSKKERQVFALAEMNRSMAELDITESVESVEKQIKRYCDQKMSGDKIKDIKKLLPALKLIEQRKKLVENLKLVSDMSDEEFEKKEHSDLKMKLTDMLDSLVIVLTPSGSGDKSLASGIRKELADQGVRVRMDGSGDLYLKFSASLSSVFKDGVYFTFASGQASVMKENKDIISEFNTKVKAGSGDKALSEKRAVEKLASALGDKIATGLFSLN